jgi:hypothetical protein
MKCAKSSSKPPVAPIAGKQVSFVFMCLPDVAAMVLGAKHVELDPTVFAKQEWACRLLPDRLPQWPVPSAGIQVQVKGK